MNVVRAKTQESDGSAASAALTALVRLLAQQAAREWAEHRSEAKAPSALALPEKPR